MAFTLGEFTAEHEQDIAWLIALWLMIHGGDPGPDGVVSIEVSETSALLAGLLSASLAESLGAPAREEHWLGPAFTRLGIKYQSGRNRCASTHCRSGDTAVGVLLSGRWHCMCIPNNLLDRL